MCFSTFYKSVIWFKKILFSLFASKPARQQFYSLPLSSFNSEALERIPLEYLQKLTCEELATLYDKLPKKYKANDIIHQKTVRCYKHWPTEGDVPDCPPPFKINCTKCIITKINKISEKAEEVIQRHSCTLFPNFTDDEIKHFPLSYLLHNVEGKVLLKWWHAIPEQYRANVELQSKLPCLEHNSKNPKVVYRYECFQCLYNKEK